MAETKRWPQYVASFAATGGALACGTMLGWSNPASPKLVVDREYGFEITEDDLSWIGSALTLGAAIVCIPIGVLINVIGRKWTMLILVIPFIVSWALVIFASNVGMMIAGRFFGGIAGGAFCIAAPIYTGEISEKEIRGTTGFFFQLNITIGILFVYAIGGPLSVFTFSLICGIIPIIFGIVFFFMPESPLFLVHKGQIESATQAIAFLRGKDFSPDAELAALQLEQTNITINPFKHIDGFKRRNTIKGFIVCCGLMFFQQFCGINVVIFYSTDIFGAAKVNKEIGTTIVGVVQVVATFISTMIVDKVGRRILLLLSDFVMALCTIVLGVFFYLESIGNEDVEDLGWLTVLCVCLFIVMFSIGFGPVPWLMVGELFGPDVKGLCGSLGGTFNWLLAFIVTKTFADLRDAMGIGGTFWLFSVLSLLGTVFVFFLVPETKGITLAEIQAKLDE